MKSTLGKVTDHSLNTDINELAHSLVREFAMASKKAGIYGTGHPLSFKALDKPFHVIETIFRFKRFININVRKNSLYVLNIKVKETVFSDQLLHYLQLLDISSMTFESGLDFKDFAHLVELLVQRKSHYDSGFSLATALKEKGIKEAGINSEFGLELFENKRQYRGEFDGDFSVKRFVLDVLGTDFARLGQIYKCEPDKLQSFGIDYTADLVRYLIPDRVASLKALDIREQLSKLVAPLKDGNASESERALATELYMSAMRLVEFHPDKEIILEGLDDAPSSDEKSHSGSGPEEAAGAIKTASRSRIDGYMDELFVGEGGSFSLVDYAEAFNRLLTTGQREKAFEVAQRLLDLLGSPDPDFRQKSLSLLLTVVESLGSGQDSSVIKLMVDETARRINEQTETFEYSEFVWKLFSKCFAKSSYENLVVLTEAIASRRHIEEDSVIFDSIAIEKAHESINRQSVIDSLVAELVELDRDKLPHIRAILVAIGSEEVGFALASIISHPIRNVRQQSLKILAELGKASLKVCSRILNNDSFFERDSGRHELPDAKWYVVRNAMFVLGLLKDLDGVVPLRLRLSDNDVRVRREIVSSLEKIGGEDSVDCLVFMAEDVDREIREAAISAIGVIADSDASPLLIDLLKHTKTDAIRIVSTLGKLGGDEARYFLVQLVEDDQLFSDLADGRVTRDDLKAVVVRAIGAIGEPEDIECLKNYQSNQSATQKIFFKNSAANKAIAAVLSQK